MDADLELNMETVVPPDRQCVNAEVDSRPMMVPGSVAGSNFNHIWTERPHR